MIEKDRVVGSGSQSPNALIEPAGDLLFLVVRLGPLESPGAHPLPEGLARLWVGDIPGHVVEQALQRMRSGGAQNALRVAVGVHVGDGLLVQFFGMLFAPLCRADQSPLLGIPAREDDG